MNFLADAADVERLLLAVVIQMPLVEPGRWNDAALPAVPGSPVACGGIDGLDARIDGAVGAGDALREKWYQSPAHQAQLPRAIEGAHHGHRLSWGYVEVQPCVQTGHAYQTKFSLDRRDFGGHVPTAHGESLIPNSRRPWFSHRQPPQRLSRHYANGEQAHSR
jgi:hypothetical protein